METGHLVAWPAHMQYHLEKASNAGWISTWKSGEGLVCRFTGPGRIYIQTKNPTAFGLWCRPFLTTQ